MKLYAGKHDKGTKERIFNYRLSRARRIVENAFGIMCSAFRVLRKPMLLNTQKAQIITLACIYFHNYLRNSKTSSRLYCPHGMFDYENSVTHDIIQGTWRGDDSPIANLYPLTQVGRRLGVDAKETSEEFAEYFKTEIGMLSWQDSAA